MNGEDSPLALRWRMSTTVRMTADELLQQPNDGPTIELVDGEPVVMSPAGRAHGVITGRLFGALLVYIQAKQLGELYTENTGVLLHQQPDLLRCPDIAFVSAAKLPQDDIDFDLVRVIPDLVVETVSRSDRVYDVEQKVQEYLTAGVRCVWVLSPIARTVTIYEPEKPARVLIERDTLDGGAVVPGFQLPIANLFAHVRRVSRP
jgi:Uma2 family endonuclease